MDVDKIAHELEQMIKQELVCLEKLNDLIAKEHEAIKYSRAESLKIILSEKNPLISQLQSLDQQRNQVLVCHGLSPSKEAFNELIAHSNNPQLQEDWNQLKMIVKKCKNNNEVNGRLIHMRKNNNDSILKILLGQRHNGADLYNPSGKTGNYNKSGLSAMV